MKTRTRFLALSLALVLPSLSLAAQADTTGDTTLHFSAQEQRRIPNTRLKVTMDIRRPAHWGKSIHSVSQQINHRIQRAMRIVGKAADLQVTSMNMSYGKHAQMIATIQISGDSLRVDEIVGRIQALGFAVERIQARPPQHVADIETAIGREALIALKKRASSYGRVLNCGGSRLHWQHISISTFIGRAIFHPAVYAAIRQSPPMTAPLGQTATLIHANATGTAVCQSK